MHSHTHTYDLCSGSLKSFFTNRNPIQRVYRYADSFIRNMKKFLAACDHKMAEVREVCLATDTEIYGGANLASSLETEWTSTVL